MQIVVISFVVVVRCHRGGHSFPWPDRGTVASYRECWLWLRARLCNCNVSSVDIKVLHMFELGDPCHPVHYKLGAVVEVSMWVTLIHGGVEFLESQ